MNVFYSDKKELRSGWKIVRVFVLVIILAVFLGVLLSLLKVDPHGKYAIPLAIIGGVLLELWLSRKPLSYVGLNFNDQGLWKDFFVGMAWGGLSILLVAGGMLFITREINVNQLGRGIEIANLASVLFVWLLVAVSEEILFRGYILSAFQGHAGIKVGLVISAGIFSVIHLVNPDYYWFAFLFAFMAGLMFGGIAIKRGNLGCVIGFHFLWNLLQEEGWLNMPDRGGEVVFTIVLLINLGLVYWLLPYRSLDPLSNPLAPHSGSR